MLIRQKSFCFSFFRKRRVLFFSEEKNQKTFISYAIQAADGAARPCCDAAGSACNGAAKQCKLLRQMKKALPLLKLQAVFCTAFNRP
jgi:hypothetical protein